MTVGIPVLEPASGDFSPFSLLAFSVAQFHELI